MLQITIPAGELFNEKTEEFISSKEQTLQLEHSLVSLSKWESKWHKPFLSNKEKTYEETIDYIRCMTLTPNVNPDCYFFLTTKNIEEINNYIKDPMTATTFSNNSSGNSRQIITSELIYYDMIQFNVPVEFQKWHINRLLTLLRVCSIKGQPTKKMSQKDLLSRNAALNAARRKSLNTKG